MLAGISFPCYTVHKSGERKGKETMSESYRVLFQGGSGEIVEKKSRFLAALMPVRTEAEALAFIEGVRKEHWNASHNCYAWVIGKQGELKRFSDDGEPSQTAGKPILGVLEVEGFVHVCAVVTRYFGGTLLGTGGLIRAYTRAVQEGIAGCGVLEVKPAKKVRIEVGYGEVGKVQYLFGQNGIVILDSVYMERVEFLVLVPGGERDKERGVLEVLEVTGGKALVNELGVVYYGMWDKEVVLYDGELVRVL